MAQETDFNERRWTLSDIARATGGNANTLRSWMQRGLIVAEGSRAPIVQGPGLANLHSTFAALQFAVMVALNKAGVDIELAADAGMDFAHFGIGSGTGFDVGYEDPIPSRDPGGLFRTGGTYVLACPASRLAQVCHSAELERAMGDIKMGHTGAAVVVLDMDEIQPRVLFRLEHPAG